MNNNELSSIRKDLKKLAHSGKAKSAQRFFKTGPGEYAEGDLFLGITVPELRRLARVYACAHRNTILQLLCSSFHEERLLALFLLVRQFQKGDYETREQIFRMYITHTQYINNWDLVDSSAEHIVGAFVYEHGKNNDVLHTFARSKNIWKRRIAIIATFYFIKQGTTSETVKIAKLLLNDTHDLIHKAVGWMLREVGKRCSQETEEAFLQQYYHRMPRTMLRYAIERFPKQRQQAYLKGRV